jgi:hypothetical protein
MLSNALRVPPWVIRNGFALEICCVQFLSALDRCWVIYRHSDPQPKGGHVVVVVGLVTKSLLIKNTELWIEFLLTISIPSIFPLEANCTCCTILHFLTTSSQYSSPRMLCTFPTPATYLQEHVLVCSHGCFSCCRWQSGRVLAFAGRGRLGGSDGSFRCALCQFSLSSSGPIFHLWVV